MTFSEVEFSGGYHCDGHVTLKNLMELQTSLSPDFSGCVIMSYLSMGYLEDHLS